MTRASAVAVAIVASLLLGAPTTADACLRPAIGVDIGGGLEKGSQQDLRAVGTLALAFGLGLDQCFGWPLRIEAALGSSTRGPPWWRGVTAVSVLSYTIDAGVIAGPSVGLLASDDGEQELGLELLVGPHLRIVGVAMRIQGSESTAVEPRFLGRVVGGVFGRYHNIRLHLRVDWIFPADGNLLLGFAYLF